MTSGAGAPGAVRYPRRFEIFRLEALGADPYLTAEEAAARYEGGRGLSVIAPEDPPSWYIEIGPGGDWFLVTFYTPGSTPLREVRWDVVDGVAVRRRVVDLFYPEGDPHRRIASADVVTVAQDAGIDGVLGVTVSSPLEEDTFREVSGVAVPTLVPEFGAWDTLLAASAPPPLERFDWDAIESSTAFADACVAQGVVGSPAGGWRVPADARDIVAAIRAVASDRPVRPGIAVIERGAARIIPLLAQGDPARTGRDPREERRRADRLATAVDDGCEQVAGRSVPLDLGARGGTASPYARALRAAGARTALVREFWPDDAAAASAVGIVWSGEAATGDLTLAVHVVPVAWLSERQAGPDAREDDLRWTADDLPRGA